jgi:signal transduction histidine kinase
MDDFDSDISKSYNFPRFENYQAGLYREDFTPIFTLIKDNKKIIERSRGFHHTKEFYYYIYPLVKNHYFGANYLIVSRVYTPTKIYLLASIIFSSIIVILFLFSRYILKNFSKPFEDINSELDRFIRDSMHEINTPLSIININIDLFSRKYGKSRYLARIKAASKTLSTIYDDMDYLIKYERMKFQKEHMDFSTFLHKRIDYFKEIASQKGVEIKREIEDKLNIFFNPTKLQRIIDNTISNAIKYSYDNSEIIISLKSIEDGIELSIQDFGIGIEDTKKILKRYYRESHQKGGFGIGLDIVKQIVDIEDIDMRILSSPKKGTTFIYIFKENL